MLSESCKYLPSTAAGSPIFIPDIEQAEPNIHAGIKYMRYLVDKYFHDPEIDPVNRLLFAFAGYNAGPNRIARLRRQAGDHGFDPNQWFQNVEYMVAGKVGQEPIRYVGNIYKYYLAYRRLPRAGPGEHGNSDLRVELSDFAWPAVISRVSLS